MTRQRLSAEAETVARLTTVVDRLRSRLRAQRRQAAADGVLELAKGVLVERLHCAPAEAEEQLRRLAEGSELPVLDWAVEVVNQAADDPAAVRVPDARPDPVPDGTSRRAADRQTLLAQAAALAAADSTEVAEAVFEQALDPLAASTLALWLLRPDGGLELVGQHGLDALETSRWRLLPPQLDSLAQRVAGHGAPLWLPRGLPGRPAVAVLGGRAGVARAVLPLRDRNRLVGIAEVVWSQPKSGFSAVERKQLNGCAEVCARALADDRSPLADLPVATLLDGLLESVLIASAVREVTGQVVDFRLDYLNENFTDPAGRYPGELLGQHLLAAYPSAAGAGGLFDLAVRALTDHGRPPPTEVTLTASRDDITYSVIATVSVSRYYDGVLIGWQIEPDTERLDAFLQHAQRLGHSGGFEQNPATGVTIWTPHTFALFGLPAGASAVPLDRLRAYTHPHDGLLVGRFLRAVLREHRASTVTFRLIRADGAVRRIRILAQPVTDPLGNLVSVRGAYQDVSAQYHTELALEATRDQLADSEQRVADEHRLARQLQRVIMPPAVPSVHGDEFRVVARLRPASQDTSVGGDWYDVLALPGGEVLLAVGDIAGHGISAATGMVTVRNALRGLAVTAATPDRLLTWLNTVSMAEGVTGTVVCGRYDPETRTLHWARAGHLPPVLVRAGEATILPVPRGMMLGASGDAHYEQAQIELAAGDVLLMFTDGLVERRDADLDAVLTDLLAHAARPDEDLDDYCDRLLAASQSGTDDDTCLIAIRVH